MQNSSLCAFQVRILNSFFLLRKFLPLLALEWFYHFTISMCKNTFRSWSTDEKFKPIASQGFFSMKIVLFDKKKTIVTMPLYYFLFTWADSGRIGQLIIRKTNSPKNVTLIQKLLSIWQLRSMFLWLYIMVKSVHDEKKWNSFVFLFEDLLKTWTKGR